MTSASTIVRLIGWLMLGLFIVGILLCAMGLSAFVSVSRDKMNEAEVKGEDVIITGLAGAITGAVGTAAGGLIFVISVGSGLTGYLFLRKKRLYQCGACGFKVELKGL